MLQYLFFLLLWMLLIFYTNSAPIFGGHLEDILDADSNVENCLFGGYHTISPIYFPSESQTKVECGGRVFK